MSTHDSSKPDNASSSAGSESIQAKPSVPTQITSASGIPQSPAAQSSASPRKKRRARTISPEALAKLLNGLDMVVVAGVLLLTFALASFAVHNSDFWSHLGTGRLIAQGHYSFGKDPFAFTTEGVYWANHSWLFDWVLYLGYETLGGPALVVLKAALLTGLALLLLSIRAPGQRYLAAACFVGLAMLALSPRFLLQSAVLSYVLLGVTVWLLMAPRGDTLEPGGTATPWWRSSRRWWLLPLIFWLWVNLDAWFLLGPITLALFAFGAALSNWQAQSRGDALPMSWLDVRKLALVLGIGLVAMVANPHHVRAFTLPAQLSPGVAAALQGDPMFRNYFISPFSGEFFGKPEVNGYASQAYFALVVLGWGITAAWGLRQRWELVLPCLAMFALSCWSVRCVPFFAVAMAPVATLNLHRLLQLRWTPEKEHARRAWLIVGRVAAVVMLLALLGLSWPGWLSPERKDPQRVRRVQWKLAPDTSLELTARQLHDWHQQKQIPAESRSFIASMDLAHYCAWFCPEEKVFLDYRWELYPAEVLAEYRTLLGDLRPEPNREQQKGIRDIFRKYHINRVADYSPRGASRGMRPIWRLCWAQRHECPMLYFDGRTLVCAWSDPNAAATDSSEWSKAIQLDDPFDSTHSELFKQAFGSGAVRAPETGARWPVEARTVWDDFLEPPPTTPLEADTGFGILQYLQAMDVEFRNRDRERRDALAKPARAANLVGVGFALGNGPGWIGTVLVDVGGMKPSAGDIARANLQAGGGAAPAPRPSEFDRISYVIAEFWKMAYYQGSVPLYLPYLSLRHARKAITESPHDAAAYRTLAIAYGIIQQQTPELNWIAAEPLLGSARRTQKLAALNQACLMDDSDVESHELLAVELQYQAIDVALAHFDKAQDARKKMADDPNVAPAVRERLDKEINAREKGIEQLRAEVEKLRDQFLKDTQGLPERARAERAVSRYGLAEEALKLLHPETTAVPDSSDQEAMARKVEQLTLRLQILLDLGRVNDPDIALTLGDTHDAKSRLADQIYLNAFRLAMALGNYREADELLESHLKADEKRDFENAVLPYPLGAGELKSRMSVFAMYLQGIPKERIDAQDGGYVASALVARMLLNAPFTPRPLAYEMELEGARFLHTFTVGRVAQVKGVLTPAGHVGGNLAIFAGYYRRRAEVWALRGLIALEAGDIAGAQERFRGVIDTLYPEQSRAAAVEDWKRPTVDCPLRRMAVYWLRELSAIDSKR